MRVTSQTTIVLALLAAAGGAWAQAKAEPDYSFSYNVGAVTDYRYRGISQSRLKPALQGGIDVAHKSGFYLGTWGSTIKWIKDAGGDAPVELDFYGGYKGTAGAVGYDVGALRYQYPGHDLAVSPNTSELYLAGTVGPATLKYSHAVTNLFGFADSKNSGYLELGASFDIGNGWSLAPHVGHQKVKHNSAYSYTDYALTLAKDFGNGLAVSLAAVGTDAARTLYVTPAGKFTGKRGLVAGVKYSF
ncbi:TorF family putative porin [Ramlibacter sp.]|uniref:TorF family putative porin n=1 Tax=Ramlibacter sp. TaxID=1917967 RepID=UPI002CC9C19B|nr:TorF family putative porin [Ramlibacter sp.]HWI82163.1 TorF family putative porin [Ramlibacter sp.]